MAGKNDTFSAQLRNAAAQQFEAQIQLETDPQRKSALGQAKSDLQASLVGMTGAEASAAIIAAIHAMKDL
jgi:hypothetical protein